jgi:hypothetical protein
MTVVATNVLRFYGCWLLIFVGGVIWLTGGLVPDVFRYALTLAAALVPAALLSSLAVLPLPPKPATRWLVALLAAGLSYLTVTLVALAGDPSESLVPVLVSPLNLVNLLAIISALVFGKVVRLRTDWGDISGR